MEGGGVGGNGRDGRDEGKFGGDAEAAFWAMGALTVIASQVLSFSPSLLIFPSLPPSLPLLLSPPLSAVPLFFPEATHCKSTFIKSRHGRSRYTSITRTTRACCMHASTRSGVHVHVSL